MFGEAIRKLLIQVISSWQVWVVTIVLIIYIAIVKSVSRISGRRPKMSPPKVKKSKAAAPAVTKKDDLDMDEIKIEQE